jgi:hypothetical protein
MKDISVSRFHSLIKKNKDGTFSVEDNHSKFGSLVFLQVNRMNIIMDQPLSIQVGRTFFTLQLKRPFNFFSCFSGNKKPNKAIDYQTINVDGIKKETSWTVKEMFEEEKVSEQDVAVDMVKKLETPENEEKMNDKEIEETLKKNLFSLRKVNIHVI